MAKSNIKEFYVIRSLQGLEVVEKLDCEENSYFENVVRVFTPNGLIKDINKFIIIKAYDNLAYAIEAKLRGEAKEKEVRFILIKAEQILAEARMFVNDQVDAAIKKAE